MNAIALGVLYIHWLYSEGIREFFHAWMNYHWFLYHFFSMPVLARTFFAPWRRMQEKPGRGFDPEAFFQRLVINTILRVIGMVIRAGFLIAAAISHILLFFFGGFLFLYFATSPISIPITFFTGFLLLFV